MVGTEPEISFILTAKTAGVYTCQVSAEGFPPKISVARVHMRGPPVITEMSSTVFASVGEDFLLFCQAAATPPAERLFWTLNGNIVENNQEVIVAGDGSLVKTTLVVENTNREQFGSYMCHVENQLEKISGTIVVREIGNDEAVKIFVMFYHLIIAESLPMMVVTTAIITGFLFTMVVMVLLITCRKCRFSFYLLWHRLQTFVNRPYSDKCATNYYDKKKIIQQEDFEAYSVDQTLDRKFTPPKIKSQESFHIYVIQNPKILQNIPDSMCLPTNSNHFHNNVVSGYK